MVCYIPSLIPRLNIEHWQLLEFFIQIRPIYWFHYIVPKTHVDRLKKSNGFMSNLWDGHENSISREIRPFGKGWFRHSEQRTCVELLLSWTAFFLSPSMVLIFSNSKYCCALKRMLELLLNCTSKSQWCLYL